MISHDLTFAVQVKPKDGTEVDLFPGREYMLKKGDVG
jgi:hypothetical protein